MSIGNRWQGTFRMVPDSLWTNPEREPIDLVVWCALMMHARDRGETNSTNASLASATGISLATLKRSLARLARMGFVRVEGEGTRRVIHLVPDAQVATYQLKVAHA